jgi:hypothetical protein
VIGVLLLVFGVLALLSRIQNGRYVRPILQALAKIPLFRRWMTKASRAALEKQNPELASALDKFERAGATRDPQKAQAAISRLTAAERKAWLETAQEQGALPEPMNRQQRRQQQRMRKRSG